MQELTREVDDFCRDASQFTQMVFIGCISEIKGSGTSRSVQRGKMHYGYFVAFIRELWLDYVERVNK